MATSACAGSRSAAGGVCRFTQAPPDRINYLVTRRGEELPEPALIFLDALREHLLGRDNVQVYL